MKLIKTPKENQIEYRKIGDEPIDEEIAAALKDIPFVLESESWILDDEVSSLIRLHTSITHRSLMRQIGHSLSKAIECHYNLDSDEEGGRMGIRSLVIHYEIEEARTVLHDEYFWFTWMLIRDRDGITRERLNELRQEHYYKHASDIELLAKYEKAADKSAFSWFEYRK
jgi:hypothetical protein